MSVKNSIDIIGNRTRDLSMPVSIAGKYLQITL